jgi:hypothetical protein
MRATIVLLLVVASSLAPALACSRRERDDAVRPLAVADPAAYWTSSGFCQMTPPIRAPSRDGVERIVVWLRIPGGASLGVQRRADGSFTLTYPAGTIADRVDLRDGDDATSVSDVRGTRFDRDGEYFHVLRPERGGLDGLEWPRDDERAGRQATARMVERLADAGVPEDGLLVFEEQNDCAVCHVHDKAEHRTAADDGLPNRATDARGLYVPAAVLTDAAPLERHRARDMNEGDRFIHVTCQGDRPARFVTRRGTRHFACDGPGLPYARYDLVAALAAGDAHARAVCASRRYLYGHMDDAGRAAFAPAFDECGLSVR